MFFRRGVSDDDPWLNEKLWIFGIGAVIALVGMALENGLLMGIGALCLLAGIAIRWIPRGAHRDDPPDAD